MASVITHSLAAVIIGKSFIKNKQSPGFWFSLVICSLLPDIDVVGFKFGIRMVISGGIAPSLTL